MPRVRTVAHYSLAFLIIMAVNFLLPRMVPGDPVNAIFGQCGCITITPEIRAKLIERFALDQPLWKQLIAYLSALAQGDFGYSYYYNSPVLKVIAPSLPWTLLLAGSATLVSSVAGIALGLESGWKRGRFTDRLLLAGVMIFNGLPDFFVAVVLLLVFGVILGVMPLAGGVTPYSGLTGLPLVADVLKHLVLPAISLILVNMTGSYLLTRNTTVTTIKEPFIITARAKGLPDRVIKYRHAGRNSILPAVTRIGVHVGRLFVGTLLVEMVFTYPGMGTLAYKAVDARDYPLLQGILLVVTVCVLITNLCVDLLYRKIDPRLKS